MTAKQLVAERLLLEPLSLKQLSSKYVGWLNDPQVNKYLETRGGYTIEKLRSFLEEQEKKKILFWAIYKKQDTKHIGNIKIDPIDESKNSGEYGILIGDKEEWGKGFAKEASWAAINFCFNELKLEQITLGVVEDNEAAVELYKKMGFKVTGKIENKGFYNGKICDSIRMVLKNGKQ